MPVSPDSRINKKLKKSKETRNKQAKKRNEKRAETKKNKKDKGSLSSRIGNFFKKDIPRKFKEKNAKYYKDKTPEKIDAPKKSDTPEKIDASAIKTKEPKKSDTPKKPKKFDYKNKKKTKMSNAKGIRNARGRSSSEIANDPSFMTNTSKGKYLRGIHSSLLKQGMASGGAVKKPSTKPSAGNKWN